MLEGRRELLEAFRRGDGAALETVYRACAGEVAALLLRGFSFRSRGTWVRFRGFPPGAGRADLDDALDDVFARAFAPAARAAYDGLRPYGAFLATLTRNVVVDLFREKTRHFEVLLAEPVGDQVASTDEPADERMLRGEASALARTFVEGLPLRWRDVYEARFVSGLDREAAARRLALGEKRLRTIERRIRERFRRFLAERGWLAPGEAEARSGDTLEEEEPS